jgi:hypothetical protein
MRGRTRATTSALYVPRQINLDDATLRGRAGRGAHGCWAPCGRRAGLALLGLAPPQPAKAVGMCLARAPARAGQSIESGLVQVTVLGGPGCASGCLI